MINQRLKKYFKENSINVEETAIKIGVSKQTLYNILNGDNDPGVSIVEGICQIYWNLSPLWLITGKGEMHLNEQPKSAQYIEDRINSLEKEVDQIKLKIGRDPAWKGMTIKENVNSLKHKNQGK